MDPVASLLTLDQLRTLIAVEDAGSFTAAGRRLGRAQSAISHTIQALELHLGVSLFDRTTKTPKMTPAGRLLVLQARQIMGRAEALEAHAASMSAGVEPDLTLAIDSIFPSAPLAASLKAVGAVFPDLPLTLYSEPIGAAERRLQDGSAQIALYAFPTDRGCDFETRLVARIAMAPVAAPTHPLGRVQGQVGRRLLEEHAQLILTDPVVGREGPTYGVVSPHVWRFADLARRLDFLVAGFGWGNMPVHLVRRHLDTGDLVRLELEEPSLVPAAIPIHAVHKKSRPPGKAGRWLLNDLSKRLSGAGETWTRTEF